MNAKKELAALELKAFTAVFEDGLWDVYLGLMLLGMGVSILLDDLGYWLSEYWILIFSPLLILPILLKKWITVPRMGVVKFGSKRRYRVLLTVVLFFFIFLAGLTLYRSPDRPFYILDVPITRSAFIWFHSTLLIFCIAAFLLNFNRLYLYSILFALPYPFRMIMKQAPGWSVASSSLFFISAAIIMVIGLRLLRQFLRKYSRRATAVLLSEVNGGIE
ncbi:MAG: hypothetical protein EHM72_15800 [Calditrichaeota bacterium]|nr:MAG: hypothetical protein EHM72_15800 [Calditrichota bacterium]